MKRLALVLLPALALAAPDPEGLGTWGVPRVAFDCRLFEVLPGKAATVPDGFVPAGRAVKWKRGTIPAGMLRSFFDGSFEAMEGVSLAWSGSLEASRFSPARVSVPLPPSAASTRKLDLSVSASHSDVANAARFDVGFAFRDAGTADEPSAAVPEETGDSGLVPGDSGFGIVLRGSSGPVDPDVLLAIGNWRLAGFERVPVRPVGLDELRPRYVALAALAVQGADRLAEALCRDFEDPAGHGAALAWIAEAANALGSSDPHPPADAPFLSDAGYVEALVAVGLAAFCESDWHDETSFEAILGIWAPHAPRSLRAHALARYAGQGNPLPAPRNLPAWRWGRPNRFEGDSPEARRALSGLAESVIPHFDGNRDCTADVVFGLFPEQMPALAGLDRRDSLPAVAGSAVPAVAERAALVERAILHAEEAAEADAAGYPAVRRPPPGAVEGLFLLAEPVRTPAVHAAGEPILFDVVLSNAGPFSVTVEETSPRVEYRFDGRRPLDWPDDGLLELTRRFWTELPPGAVGNRARLDLSDWVSNDVPRRVRAPLRRDLDLAGTRWAETEVEFEILSAADPATNAPAATDPAVPVRPGNAEAPRILRRYGADATAPVVDATLSWLRAQQRDDGSWPGDPPAATTALALLAHVVHSDLPGDGTEAGAAVERGFGFLLADLDPETGRFRSAEADPLVQPLGALALAEATGMTHDPRLAAAAAAALRALAAGRRPDGVWNADPLDPAPGGTGDVFATVWCVLALRASTTWRCDELPSAELQEVLERALEALEALAGPDSPRASAGGVWPDPAVAAAAFVLAEGGRCNSPVRVRMGEALAPVRVDLARPEKSVVPSRAWDSPPCDCFFLANADWQGAHPYVFPEWNKHMLGNLPDVRGWERSADGVRDACFTALSLMVYYAWTPWGLTWCPGAHDPPPPPQRIRLRAKAPAGVLPRHVRNDYSLDGPVHYPDECATATNAPAATLEQLLAEPWRKRLSPDADPVAEMRKIGTLDAFADTRVLFFGPGVCLTKLKNDPERIAPERDRCNLVRELFRETRPATGLAFARGGSSRILAFDKLPRETDEEFPKPVRAVPFEFYGFAPADAADDFVVRLPGDDDRWVLVPGLGAFAMPEHAAENTRPAEVAESEPHAE